MTASDDADPDKARNSTAPSNQALEAVVEAALARVASRGAQRSSAVSAEFLQSLCTLLLDRDQAAAEAMVRSRIARSQSYAEIADEILAAAARELGQRWEDDRISFADVATTLSALHRLHQHVGRRNAPLVRALETPHAVFATLPRQSHTFGIILATEGFREAGWRVDLQLETVAKDIVAFIRRLRPDAVGLTTSLADPQQPLKLLIGQIERLPFRVPILLGGNGAPFLYETLPPATAVVVAQDIRSALRAARPTA